MDCNVVRQEFKGCHGWCSREKWFEDLKGILQEGREDETDKNI